MSDLLPIKDKTLLMIGNAHLDPVWLWQWQEGFQAAKATFRSALDRMTEAREFIFTSSSAAIYEWIEANDPALFAEIRQRVAEGRWRIAGGWWIEPDCNIPNGESFVRQGLYGQRYFQEKFGITATVGYNVDSFGHHAMLPQILCKSGLDSYVCMRPSPAEMGLPGRIFWWELDDGSRVLAFRIPYSYGVHGSELETHVLRCAAELEPPITEMMCFYGVGNHGGGPTRETLEHIRQMDEDPAFPRLIFSAPDRFFDDMRHQELPLPVLHEELQHHARGCYAAHSGVKRWNRQAENLLLTAEAWSAIAEQAVDQPYPLADLTRAWKQVLFNQFHDILAGTSLEPAYDDARDAYGEAMAIAARSLNQAIQRLSWAIDIDNQEGMTPIVVFNPHAWAARLPVELEFGPLTEHDGLVDERNEPAPLQAVQSLATGGASRRRLCFVAELPPLGYRVYQVAPRPTSLPAPTHTCAGATLENEWLRLEIDPATGYLASLVDKRVPGEILSGAAAKPIVIADPSDTWSHGVLRFDDVIGAFTATAVKRVEHGPVRSTVRVDSAYGASHLVQEIILYHALDVIEIRATVDWREHFKLLKLVFPLNLESTEATYEIPYGVVQRAASGDEEPGQSWFDLTGVLPRRGDRYGLSILNDGKYSFSAKPRELQLTVLRSPIYAHHDPTKPDPNGYYRFIDQGIQRFTYTLLPHAGTWKQAHTVRRAAELNRRPIPLVESCHRGSLPRRQSYLSVDRDNIVVGAIKRAEENDDLIIRCYETDGAATHAVIELSGWRRRIDADFAPHEIKTFRVPREATLPVTETDLIEWDSVPVANRAPDRGWALVGPAGAPPWATHGRRTRHR